LEHTIDSQTRIQTRPYLLALAATLAAVLVRWLLEPWLAGDLPFITLYGAIAFAVWSGGVGPALLASVVGYLAAVYLFVDPRGTLGFHSAKDLVAIAAHVTSSMVIIYLGWVMRSAQAEAQQRLQSLKTTVASIGDAVIATDTEGRVQWLNASAEILTGWPQVEAIGQPLKHVFHTVHEQTRLPVEDPATRALRGGVVGGAADHTLLMAKDGAERPIDDSAAAIRDETGQVTGFILVFRDVTDRRRAEADRLASARLLASIVESSEDAIISKSLDGIIQTWNAAAQRLCGFALRDLLDSPVAQLFRTSSNDQLDLGVLEGRKVHAPYSQRHIQMKSFRSGVWLAVDLTLVRLTIRPEPILLLTVRTSNHGHSDLCSGSDDETVC
jgi:PAS domain S-box-containing protein